MVGLLLVGFRVVDVLGSVNFQLFTLKWMVVSIQLVLLGEYHGHQEVVGLEKVVELEEFFEISSHSLGGVRLLHHLILVQNQELHVEVVPIQCSIEIQEGIAELGLWSIVVQLQDGEIEI